MAATRKPARKPVAKPATLLERTPIAEWTAAGIGLVLTLGVVGYSLSEALAAGADAPPDLRATVTEVQPVGGRHIAQIEVRNLSRATAAEVTVSATLSRGGAVVERRETTVDYVPARGAARAGVIFRQDPAGGDLQVAAEAYVEP
jgi:uncharacterized protein (TIGR02588 family)